MQDSNQVVLTVPFLGVGIQIRSWPFGERSCPTISNSCSCYRFSKISNSGSHHQICWLLANYHPVGRSAENPCTSWTPHCEDGASQHALEARLGVVSQSLAFRWILGMYRWRFLRHCGAPLLTFDTEQLKLTACCAHHGMLPKWCIEKWKPNCFSSYFI